MMEPCPPTRFRMDWRPERLLEGGAEVTAEPRASLALTGSQLDTAALPSM
jgi:hypothetical protein